MSCIKLETTSMICFKGCCNPVLCYPLLELLLLLSQFRLLFRILCQHLSLFMLSYLSYCPEQGLHNWHHKLLTIPFYLLYNPILYTFLSWVVLYLVSQMLWRNLYNHVAHTVHYSRRHANLCHIMKDSHACISRHRLVTFRWSSLGCGSFHLFMDCDC